MKRFMLMVKVLVFGGLALFLVFQGDRYFELPPAWRYILIAVLLLLAAIRLFEWFTYSDESRE
jgi:intracellular septation protein A